MSGSWSNNATTSLTLPTGAVPPQQRITLDGSSDTILIYSATGALIASIAATAGTDGLGNSYPAGISSTGGVISDSIILVYSGTPALGTLLASIASAASTDSFGNGYVAGIGTYDYNIDQVFTALQAGQVLFGSIVGHIPDTADAGLIAPSINGNTNTLGIESPTNVAMIQPALLQLFSGNGSATTGQPGVPHVKLSDTTSVQPGDAYLSGTMIQTDLSGTLLTWQTPSFNAGYSAGGAAQYRATGLDEVKWDLAVTQTTGVGAAGGAVVIAAVPAQYRPKGNARMVPCAWESSGSVCKGAAMFVFNTNGTVSLLWPAATANGDKFSCEVSIPLGNIS